MVTPYSTTIAMQIDNHSIYTLQEDDCNTQDACHLRVV